MALSKFHIVAFLVAANRQKFSDDCIKKAIPYVVLPDAIRCFSLARTITHFEVGENGVANGMTFPEDVKNITEESDLGVLCETNGTYNQVAIGDTTSIEKFEQMNKELSHWAFTFVKLHLQQDMLYDAYIRKVIDCSRRHDEGNPFYFGGRVYDAKSVRTLISEIEEQEFRKLSQIYEEESGIKVTQEWFDFTVAPIINEAYGKTMAEKTLSYIHIDNEATVPVHLTSEEQLKGMLEMIKEIIKISEDAIISAR